MSTMTVETIMVEKRTIACDGGGGSLGHPRVFLTLTPSGEHEGIVECPYCGRTYILKPGAGGDDHH